MTRLFVPGRIEVLGKHTDYAGGRSLLAAVDRGFTVEVVPADDGLVTVVDTARGEATGIPVTDPPRPGADPDPDWAVYPRTVVNRVVRDFPGRLQGCRIELASDLPAAAGLSSSSALVTAVFLAVDSAADLARTDRYQRAIPDRETLAAYLGAVERGTPFPVLNTRPDASSGKGPGAPVGPGVGEGPDRWTSGVGTRGGSEDHVAILCAEPGRLVQYRFEPVRREGVVPVPPGHVFAIAASGVVAEKTGAARGPYNRLSDLAGRAVELWRTSTDGDPPHLGAILKAAGVDRVLDAIADRAAPGERAALERRVRHFVAESEELVPAAADALAAGDLAGFGRTVARSQTLAEELLGNQVPETVHLARAARELGAAAASAFGAGFGGSVWALIRTTERDRFLDAWRDRYRSEFPGRAATAAFFVTHAAPPARPI